MTNDGNHLGGGHVVEFTAPFEATGGRREGRNWDGVIGIGHVYIQTDPVYEEEDEFGY